MFTLLYQCAILTYINLVHKFFKHTHTLSVPFLHTLIIFLQGKVDKRDAQAHRLHPLIGPSWSQARLISSAPPNGLSEMTFAPNEILANSMRRKGKKIQYGDGV